ncbi:MAG: CRTAC1 family protein [Planctomycetaceae bacterium]
MAGLLFLLLAPEFVDVAGDLGLKGVPAGRCTFVDLDDDGHLDVVLDRHRVFLWRDGRFSPAPPLPFAPEVALFADFDGDGFPDCFAGVACEPENPAWKDHGRSNTIFLNDGKGGWRTLDPQMPRTSVVAACAVDTDRDGILDLFVGSSYVVYGSLPSHPDRLYRGKGDGTFLDVTEKAGLLTVAEPGRRDSSKPTYGVTHGDWDGDGWQDLWVCTYGRQWNFLWRNNGDGTFTDVAEKTGFDGDADRSGRYTDEVKEMFRQRGMEREDEAPFRANGNTFDCAIADYDNDGDMDCILAEITHWWAGPSSDPTSLLVNGGRGAGFRFERRPDAFARRHADARWNQGDLHAAWLDFDNDGLLDALVASSDYPDRQELKLYRQKPDHTFEAARLFDWEGAGQLSVADFDGDGDQDILVGRSLMRLPAERAEALGPSCALFRNEAAGRNRWLTVACRGKSANRHGIGCRIRVTTADGVTQTRELRCGLGHAGHDDPPLGHFGLGRHARAERVEVVWPDRAGSATLLERVEAGRRIVVEQ